MVLIIWKEYFPEVINIYDDEFLTKFKKVYSKTFGDNKEYSDRSIAGILTRIGILCGRGEYKIKPKNQKPESSLHYFNRFYGILYYNNINYY